jgi:F-type H+-transporting ATPase subunit gamma
LCGGLNSSTVKFTKNKINELISQGRDVKIMCVGRKAYEQLKNIYGAKIIENISGVFKSTISIDIAENISQKIIELFDNDKFDVCEVIFSKFKSAISQEQVCNQIIPAPINYSPDLSILESPINYEPSESEVLAQLLPKNITIQIYNQLLENSASEQGARMSAMESASNNAGKMIKNLTLVYNRTRQANITKELIDIISGANTV